MATFSPQEWEAYERAKMAEQDARGALAVARQEGTEEGHKSGLAEGHKVGLVEGKRDALLRLLARTGLVLTQEDQERIAACIDLATLDRWFDNALGAKTTASVFS